jgi:hypothetical protein
LCYSRKQKGKRIHSLIIIIRKLNIFITVYVFSEDMKKNIWKGLISLILAYENLAYFKNQMFDSAE